MGDDSIPGDKTPEGDVTLAQIGLAPLQPYLAPWLAGPLGGHLDLQGRWTWQAPSAPADSGRATSDWTLALDELAWIAPALPCTASVITPAWEPVKERAV